jgi:hypothetical protein
VVEYLLSECEAVTSNPSIAKTNKKTEVILRVTVLSNGERYALSCSCWGRWGRKLWWLTDLWIAATRFKKYMSSSFYCLSMPSCGVHDCSGWQSEEHHPPEKRGKSLVLIGPYPDIAVWFLTGIWRMVTFQISNHWWSQSCENCCQPHRRIKHMLLKYLEKWQNHLLPSCYSSCIIHSTSAATQTMQKEGNHWRENRGILLGGM